MKQVMAILDEDFYYAERLAAYANEKEPTPFSAIAFENPEKLKAFLSHRPVELLLQCGFETEEWPDNKVSQVVILSGERLGEAFKYNDDGPGKGKKPVCKYQACDRLFNEVMGCYLSQSGSGLIKTGFKSEIIGVYSPVGRCGKTGFALTMGQVLAERHKVLYLNLEEYSALSELTGTVYKRTLSDLFYALRSGSLNESVLESALYRLGRLDYVAPAACPEDMAEIKSEEIVSLAMHTALSERYDIIICDMGHLGKDAMPLLEICKTIYTPVCDDGMSLSKVAEWRRKLADSGREELIDKIKVLHLPLPESVSSVKHYLDQLLYGRVGDTVRGMLSDF